MPADVLAVLLEGRAIGWIERTAGGALRFDYDEGIDTGATPLSMSMPSTTTRHGDGRITPWLWGLLPDNADVLSHWGRRFGVSIASPFPHATRNAGGSRLRRRCAVLPARRCGRTARPGRRRVVVERSAGGAAAALPAGGRDLLARPGLLGAVQPGRRPGQDGPVLLGGALGSPDGNRAHVAHPEAGHARIRALGPQRAPLPPRRRNRRSARCPEQDGGDRGRDRHSGGAVRSRPYHRRSAARPSGGSLPGAWRLPGPEVPVRRGTLARPAGFIWPWRSAGTTNSTARIGAMPGREPPTKFASTVRR